MKKILKKIFLKLGYSIHKIEEGGSPDARYPDMKEKEFWDIYDVCHPFTMTSVERMYALYQAVNYVLAKKIPGDFVECGVWRGGSSMLIAYMLENRNIRNRKLYLYDTFEGMSEPTQWDIDAYGKNSIDLMAKGINDKENSVWCLADLTDVKKNMTRTSLPSNQIIYIKGKVENTLPEKSPENKMALLRLDTDWYESTRHELLHLFPLLQNKGVLIIDDYGHWEGCRKAVDEYWKENNLDIFLHRIDDTGRMGIKE